MLLLLAGGVWIAMTLAIVGWIGMAFFTGTPPGKNLFTAFWGSSASWTLAALPMFIWMGEILFRTKLSEEMFEGLSPWLNKVPGRLMHTTILGCGIFGSVSGSSAATCATISKVALPELLKRGYDEKIALGSLATAGTLGILIPPSITMVVYAVAADARVLHDHVHPGRRVIPLHDHGFYRHPARAGRMGGLAQSESVCADHCALHPLHHPGHGARRQLDDRAHLRGAPADDPEGRLRSDLVRHLHRAAGGDRRGDAAGRIQPVRAAEHDRQGQ